MTPRIQEKTIDQKIDTLLELTIRANREIVPKWWRIFINILCAALLIGAIVLLKNAIYNPDKNIVFNVTSFHF